MEIHSEDYLGYWLFYAQRSVAYAFYETLKTCCQAHDKQYVVTPPQWGALSLLTNHDGQTIGALSQQRAIDPATVTGIVKRLEQSGLVERRHDPEDRRLVKVYLTDEGRDIMRFLPEAVIEFTQTMSKGFTEKEKHNLMVNLQRIIANLSTVGPDTGDRFGLLPDFMRVDQQGSKD